MDEQIEHHHTGAIQETHYGTRCGWDVDIPQQLGNVEVEIAFQVDDQPEPAPHHRENQLFAAVTAQVEIDAE